MTEQFKPGPNPLYREMDVRVDKQKTDERTVQNPDGRIPIAISSEYPVSRTDFWKGESYVEILEHTRDAVDLSYAKDGLPFLDGHDSREQMGLVEDITIGADGVLRGNVRFSQRQDAQDLKRDMLDGIKKKISVGYRQLKTETIETKDDSAPREVRVVRWLPMEASSVAIPADYSVGVGRSGDVDAEKRIANAVIAALSESSKSQQLTAPKGQERSKMSDQNAASDNGADKNKPIVSVTVEERNEAVKGERQRVSEIRLLGSKHEIDEAKIASWVAEDRSVGAVAAEILAGKQAQGSKGSPTGKPVVELTEKEQRQYSLVDAILSQADEIDGKKGLGSFEREISQELEKHFPVGVKRHGGLLVPTFTNAESAREIMAKQNGMYTRAGLDSATSTKGAELKFTVPGDFLALIRNRMKVMEAGATLMAGLQGPVAFPNQNAAGTATWMGENSGSDVAASNLTLQQIALNPKSIQSTTSYSRQLLAQAVVDVDGLVRSDLANIIALALDLAVIAGPGTGATPTGITATAGIGSVALGTNGLAPVYSNLVDLETQVTAASADLWPCSYLVHPTTRGSFKKATVLSNTVGAPVWQSVDKEDGAQLDYVQGFGSNGELNGYNAFASAQVPNNLTKGTSSGICLAIIFGAFSQAVIGDWGMMEIIVDPYILKKQGMIELTAFAMYGIAIKYPKAFAVILDALA